MNEVKKWEKPRQPFLVPASKPYEKNNFLILQQYVYNILYCILIWRL
jgi:hypothetical protein